MLPFELFLFHSITSPERETKKDFREIGKEAPIALSVDSITGIIKVETAPVSQLSIGLTLAF